MLETLDNILRVVTYIAVGGTLAAIFFVMFAQTIIGLKSLQKQLEKLIHQTEEMTDELREINHKLGKGKKE